MMPYREFCEEVRDSVRDYLPVGYSDAVVELKESVKASDAHLTGIMIRTDNEPITPCIYLENYYSDYQEGRSFTDIMEEIAGARLQNQLPDQQNIAENFLEMVRDYDKAKEHLQIRLCDPEKNRDRLAELAHTREGDFVATYHLVMKDIPGMGIGTVGLSREMLKSWNVPMAKVREDALSCDRMREPALHDITTMMGQMMGMSDEEPANYLTEADVKLDGQMYVLTNGESLYGASLILQRDIMQKIGALMGGDYYVLPSSCHEVLVVPESAGVSRQELSEMVKSVNETTVSPEEFLSDEVQHYDVGRDLLMNAEQYDMLQLGAKEKQLQAF